MSILFGACGLLGGILMGRAVARALRGNETSDSRDALGQGKGGTSRPGGEGDATEDPLAGFPCHLGDVILAANGEEAWLAGALVFREGLPMAALFIAPEAGGDRAIFVRRTPEASLLWLAPTAKGTLEVGREPPSCIEHQSLRFERTRRIPYHVDRIGTGTPDFGTEAIVAEYAAATGDRLIVVTGAQGAKCAWRGRVLEEGTYDLLPGSPHESPS